MYSNLHVVFSNPPTHTWYSTPGTCPLPDRVTSSPDGPLAGAPVRVAEIGIGGALEVMDVVDTADILLPLPGRENRRGPRLLLPRTRDGHSYEDQAEFWH